MRRWLLWLSIGPVMFVLAGVDLWLHAGEGGAVTSLAAFVLFPWLFITPAAIFVGVVVWLVRPRRSIE